MEQGVKLDVKVVRRVAYRYAERARVLQQAGQISLAEGETRCRVVSLWWTSGRYRR
jgi:hypothetical protein